MSQHMPQTELWWEDRLRTMAPDARRRARRQVDSEVVRLIQAEWEYEVKDWLDRALRAAATGAQIRSVRPPLDMEKEAVVLISECHMRQGIAWRWRRR